MSLHVHTVTICTYMSLHVPTCPYMSLHIPNVTTCQFFLRVVARCWVICTSLLQSLHVRSCPFMSLHVPTVSTCQFVLHHNYIRHYYTAGSASGQDEATPVFWQDGPIFPSRDFPLCFRKSEIRWCNLLVTQ